MTTDNQTLVEPNSEFDTSLSPGVMLAQARGHANLSIEDVAARLRLRGSVIQAIENDDYSKISRHVFARGYLRAYSRLVHLDADKVVASFNALNLMGDETTKVLWQAPKSTPATTPPNNAKKGNPVKWLFSLVTLCLVVFLGMWINANRGQQNNDSLQTALSIKEPAMKHFAKAPAEQDSLDDNINLKGKLS